MYISSGDTFTRIDASEGGIAQGLLKKSVRRSSCTPWFNCCEVLSIFNPVKTTDLDFGNERMGWGEALRTMPLEQNKLAVTDNVLTGAEKNATIR